MADCSEAPAQLLVNGSVEERFYRKDTYTCPVCGYDLLWRKRADKDDSFILLHPIVTSSALPSSQLRGSPCPHSGKAYYAPYVTQLTPIDGEMDIVTGTFMARLQKL